MKRITCVSAIIGLAMFKPVVVTAQSPEKHLKISGVYPHLALFNERDGLPCTSNGGEGGIGAITPWAGQLWMVTYSPHCTLGSSDKLYSINNNFELTVHPESVGGTPANRMIHKESNQLLTGPYLIDVTGKIRVISPSAMPGRLTATARHLTDPANLVYYYDMEGKIYEVNVHTLAVKKLFTKPVPGWHGKGAYTAQHQLVISNNGEDAVFKLRKEMLEVGDVPKTPEQKGVLASWDGKTWRIIERKQFTDITGPGGIYGSPNDKSPLWSIGWDKRSVILKLLDGGIWYTYRLPKAAHTYDHWAGWYTEWPRIRDVGNGKMLMDMHGMLYDFPKTFSRANSGGLSPLGSHLRYIPDFTYWKNQIVLSSDETTILENPLAGRSQSNLWFGSWEDLKSWGAPDGWGGPWMKDSVKAGQVSDAFLVNSPVNKTLHLAQQSGSAVKFILEVDRKGDNHWEPYKTIIVPANGYVNYIFPAEFSANWIRFKTDGDCIASAFIHFFEKAHEKPAPIFDAIADADGKDPVNASLIRPGMVNKNLQVLPLGAKGGYAEVNEKLIFTKPDSDRSNVIDKFKPGNRDFDMDDASVIVKDKTGTFRLPKTSPAYDQRFEYGWPRGKREVESERFMLNAHGTLYEVGRESGYIAIRPVTTHMKKIMDFCTWRGLLVISGTKINARQDGHYFGNSNNGLWFGAIDDLWKMGKPVGTGGVWKNTAVIANNPSLPYLMTGYDKKRVSLTADKDVNISLEVDFDLNGWHTYKKFHIQAGQTVDYTFPDGFSAHWVRAKADKDCHATAWFVYQ